MKKGLIICFQLILLFAVAGAGFAQRKPIKKDTDQGAATDANNNKSNPTDKSKATTKAAAKDSGFKHRDDLADSITITYKYLDSLRSNGLDSSLNDFNRYLSLPSGYVSLGNNGAAAYPILFTPVLKAGLDPGFHAFDVYTFKLRDTRFFKTTRPYTQLTYLLASGKEQYVYALHTQNIKPNWNFGFEYRLVSSPGFFKTQNTNHNNYRLFSNYVGKKKRYNAYVLLLGNKMNASENGGITSDTFLYNPYYKRRFTVPVRLGGDAQYGQNVFSTKVSTGNQYRDFTMMLRQSYDLGKKDSLKINDSTTEYLFYPKLRFQYTLTYSKYTFRFIDTVTSAANANADSTIFQNWYDTTVHPSANGLNFLVQDKWEITNNDFVLRQFPETKNPAQFLEAGLRLENIHGTFSTGTRKFYNMVVHGEYANKTRNKKWDALATGELFVSGLNAGDYNVSASVKRFLNRQLGDISVSFQNINRTPSFIFDNLSSFNFKKNINAKKENYLILSAAAEGPRFSLWFRNIAITNYSYFSSYVQPDQTSTLINLLQVQAFKKLRVTRYLNLYSDGLMQQSTANSPIHVPLIYTRQRLAFEGVFFKNLNLSTGLDVEYNTPFKANNYSPVMGQFFPQDSVTISNRPTVGYFFDFRIKSFRGLIKLENLNTVDFTDGFGFTHNNFAAPQYPTPGLIFRIGVQWDFVN